MTNPNEVERLYRAAMAAATEHLPPRFSPDAVRLAEAGLRLEPSHLGLNLALATQFLRGGRPGDAVRTLEPLARLHSELPHDRTRSLVKDLRRTLTSALVAEGRLHEAEACINRNVEQDFNQSDLEKLGEIRRALAAQAKRATPVAPTPRVQAPSKPAPPTPAVLPTCPHAGRAITRDQSVEIDGHVVEAGSILFTVKNDWRIWIGDSSLGSPWGFVDGPGRVYIGLLPDALDPRESAVRTAHGRPADIQIIGRAVFRFGVGCIADLV